MVGALKLGEVLSLLPQRRGRKNGRVFHVFNTLKLLRAFVGVTTDAKGSIELSSGILAHIN